MADAYTYQKKRKEFGRHAQFEDTDTKIVGSVPPDPNCAEQFIPRDPNRLNLSNIATLSQHSVNTERIPTSSKGMNHYEGGWPREIDHTEPADVQKYLKKMYRETNLGFAAATKEMCLGATKSILQNNEIDLFEEYFAGEQPENLSENISTKTLMIFKDPNPIKRAATKIAWHPETSEMRIGVTYAMLRFQQMPIDMPRESYIWNLSNPNFPEKTLLAPSPLCSMAFNQKNPDIVVGGSYNGSLSFFDTRAGDASGVVKPFRTTILEKSHHDPVYDVDWKTVGKTLSECVSTSTDGKILWWDYKSVDNGPIQSFTLSEPIPDAEGNKVDKVLGGTSLCYNAEAGPLSYLVGTEQGYVLLSKQRKQIEISQRYGVDSGKHHGPVYALRRNPGHLKYFMSVGDWSAKIWQEDLKSPVMQTRYHSAYLTDGCWSPTRCGLFFLTRIDGFLDVWDFYYRQNEVCYSQKISDSPLTSIAVNQNMAAIGDAEGTVAIMKLCPPLYETTSKEKETMFQIFEREMRREKNLENQKKDQAKAAKQTADTGKGKKQTAEQLAAEKDAALKERKTVIEEEFFNHVKEDDDDLIAIQARGEMNQMRNDDANQASSKSIAIEAVELTAGASYTVTGGGADGTLAFKLTAEAGGTFAGEANGSVQGGKLIMSAGGIEYTGSFSSKTVVEATWKDASGATGSSMLTFTQQ